MARGKYEASRKRRSPFFGILLVLAIIGATIGGVTAYLSLSSGQVTNQFDDASHPVVAVNHDNSITVQDMGYAVYLRAMVVVNWKNTSGGILAEMPVENTDYFLSLGDRWKIIDGFYYYTSKIQENTTTEPVVTIASKTEKEGYQLEVTVVAQTVQAIGQTDANPPVDAVEDAWGVTAEQITGS